MPTKLIHDGYTRDGFIASLEHDMDSLRFRYRPMLPEDVDTVLAETKNVPPRLAIQLMAATVAERLVSWDATDVNDQTATIDATNVGSLPRRVFLQLFNIVTGLMASDPIPNATKQESDEMITRLWKATGDGKPAGLAATAADRKN